MVGKLFLLAAVCIALAQGNAILDAAIKRGLQRAEGINNGGVRRIDAAIQEVEYKKKLIDDRAATFIQKSERQQEGFEQALGLVCDKIREKASETNRPESVFECVDRVQENGLKSVESYASKFRDDVGRLERVKLENIATYAKPLAEMQGNLRVRYERAVSLIKDCQNPACVTTAVNSFVNWLDQLFAQIERIRRQITTAVNNFQRDINTNFNNTSRQITRIRSASARNAALCLRNREGILEEIEN